MRPLAQAAERLGRSDLLPVWCGQGAALGRPEPAAALTRRLAAEACELLAAPAKIIRIDPQGRIPSRLSNGSSTGG